ncbi:ribonuclease H2, subunit B [Gaertneriomyces semiglobifer]|nr:ribonuclease H2, subunit B [Gaertneriomyces semiglobifer]
MSRLICIRRGEDNTVNSNEEDLIVHLPHPRTGQASYFGISPSSPHLLFLQQVDLESSRSWFINTTVQKDGSLYLMIPFDPLFVLLPILESLRNTSAESAGRYLTLDDILHSDEYPHLQRLTVIHDLAQRLKSICDCTEPSPNVVFFRLNDGKVLAWLNGKMNKLQARYEQYKALEALRAADKELDEQQKNETRLRMLVRIISDCIPISWSTQLADAHGLKDAPTYVYFDNVVKRPLANSNAKETADSSAKKQKLTPGQKALAKASKQGMKSISSFFKKP